MSYPRLTKTERAALLRVPCGAVTKRHGVRIVCDLPTGHLGRHRGDHA